MGHVAWNKPDLIWFDKNDLYVKAYAPDAQDLPAVSLISTSTRVSICFADL